MIDDPVAALQRKAWESPWLGDREPPPPPLAQLSKQWRVGLSLNR